jgi:hypothetical protein
MITINPRASKLIDQYIQRMPELAKPICRKLRNLIRRADPKIVEDWKWGPNFNRNGMVCGFGAFKQHVSFVFFRGALLKDKGGLLKYGSSNRYTRTMRFTSVNEIDEPALIEYIREAALLNTSSRNQSPASKRIFLPTDFRNALQKNNKAHQTYKNLAYTYRKEYVEWIRSAKRESTRISRIKRAIEILAKGEHMSQRYM